MFICKTATQKYSENGQIYYTYRLVRTYRDLEGKVKRETLLNLGNHFSVPPSEWRLLTDRIEQLVSNDNPLFEIEIPLRLEKEAKRIAKILRARNSITIKTTPKPIEAKDYQMVDVNSTNTDEVRYIGNEHVAYSVACQLDLPNILLEIGLNQKKANIALAAIIARLIAPSSELRAHKYLTTESALEEIIGIELSGLDLQYMYLASDWLLAHKDELEKLLYQKERELFNLTQVITLFDITNTYFEGHSSHSLKAKGRSKEKRSDCELISLGLLLDSSGFPKKSKILPGNVSEPSTLKEMLSYLTHQEDAVIIMDAGFATKENIAYLSTNNYKYIIIKRDADLVMPENDHIIVKDTANNTVTTASLVAYEDRLDLYCHSTAKEAKITEFTNKMAERFEREIQKLNSNLSACNLYADINEFQDESAAIILDDGRVFTNKKEPISLLLRSSHEDIPENFSLDNELTAILLANEKLLKLSSRWHGQIKTYSKLVNQFRDAFSGRICPTKKNVIREYEKIVIKLGRLKEQYKSVAHLYNIEIFSDKKKHYATKICYSQNQTQLATKKAGIYCLSTNLTTFSAESLWNTYTTLTEVEAAFRSLKSELGMRPVYHHLESRVDGHIFITILAYHLMHTIRYQLKAHGINNSWKSLRDILSQQIRSTVTQNLQDGGVVKIRKTSKPTPEQAAIYRALNISLQPCAMSKSYININHNKRAGREVVVP